MSFSLSIFLRAYLSYELFSQINYHNALLSDWLMASFWLFAHKFFTHFGINHKVKIDGIFFILSTYSAVVCAIIHTLESERNNEYFYLILALNACLIVYFPLNSTFWYINGLSLSLSLNVQLKIASSRLGTTNEMQNKKKSICVALIWIYWVEGEEGYAPHL